MIDSDRATAVGVALRRLRGTRDQTEAARLSGLSRQWWIDNEKGLRIARANKLAIAAQTLGGDVRELLELAGYDAEQFVDEVNPLDDTGSNEVLEAVRQLGADVSNLADQGIARQRQLDGLARRVAEIERRLGQQ